jgi:hypothetical protein
VSLARTRYHGARALPQPRKTGHAPRDPLANDPSRLPSRAIRRIRPRASRAEATRCYLAQKASSTEPARTSRHERGSLSSNVRPAPPFERGKALARTHGFYATVLGPVESDEQRAVPA